jgi:hypothetical protein
MVLTYQRHKRLSYSANFTYSTGRPATFPEDKYYVGGVYVPNYTLRNQNKIPDYHRLDLSMTLDEKPKKDRRWRGSWVISIYNVYARKNAFSVFFKTKSQNTYQYYNRVYSYRLAVFGTAFPSITYNFKF